MKHLLVTIIPALALFFACSGSGDPSADSITPGVPGGLTLASVDKTTAVVKWRAADNARSYEWKLEEGGAAVQNGTRTNLFADLKDLKAGSSYLFAVRACNGDAVSAWSETLAFNTLEDDTPSSGDEPGALCTDAPLLLQLDSRPELGTSGSIRVYDSSDRLVDEINLADIATVNIREDGQMIPRQKIMPSTVMNTFMDALKCGTRWRAVHYTPLLVKGNSLIVKLHNSVLDFGKDYCVTVDPGVIKGHPGIAKGAWTFRTKAKPASDTSVSVNQDGSADFCTVQGAISHAGSLGKSDAVVINVAAGTYNEPIYIRDKNNLTIKGAGRDRTVISYANNESYENGTGGGVSSKPGIGDAVDKENGKTTGGRAVILVESCDNLVFEDITMQNSFGELEGQAEVMYFNSSNRLTIENCALLSLQDTFNCKGKVWVHNSLIAGHCDYIWGSPSACLFEDCEIRSEAAGYIVQARVPSASDKGFVFLNCRLTASAGLADAVMYLARANDHSKEDAAKKTYDNVTFVACTMSPVIRPVGWLTDPKPNPVSADAVSGWKEYGSKDASGSALNLAARSESAHILSAAEAEGYSSRQAVLGW